ncbi:MAG: hypothetical protein ACOVMH_06440 [Flavobacterium sp.]
MKKYIILTVLFILPIVAYLFFATASHNSLFLPTISEHHLDIPSDFKALKHEQVTLENKITILGFPGSNIEEVKANLFNLNQKVYNKYSGFKDFQMVMVMPEGTQPEVVKIQTELARITKELQNWHFVFASPSSVETYFKSFHFQNSLDVNSGTPFVYIIDKKLALRGRKGQKIKGKVEYRECYNSESAAELHNEMSDDVKILLREYRLALKKNNNNRKDAFRDNITNKLEENKAN